MSTHEKIADLEAKIRYHNRLYYDVAEPEIADEDYDKLVEELKALAPDSPVLNERSQDNFDLDYKHEIPMGSQDKAKTPQDLLDRFAGRFMIETPKLDGAGVALHYNNGRLVLAVTRGRTETGKGKVVTANVAMISHVPMSIPISGKYEIRGECLIFRSDFYGIMDQPGYDGRPEGYANPRNAAAGGLTCQDPNDTKARKLVFVPWDIFGSDCPNYQSKLTLLDNCGFFIPPHEELTITGLEGLEAFLAARQKDREELCFDTDGIVLRVNNQKEYDSLGMSGVCPNGSIAYKFEAERAETVLEDVEWSVNRTGIIHPTGTLKEVRLAGSTITHCTLNNLDWMSKHGNPSIGSRIIIEKGGDIIPNLVKVLSPGNGSVKRPETCPCCGSKLGFELNADGTEGVRLKCPNRAGCKAQFVDSTVHMLKKMEIKGIDESTVEKLVAANAIQHPWNIFLVTEDTLNKAGVIGGNASAVMTALSGVRTSVSRMLAAIGIDMWGRRMFDKLLDNSSEYDETRLLAGDFVYDELVNVDFIGPAKAKALVQAFKDGWAAEFLKGLKKHVTPEYRKIPAGPKEATVYKMTFCLSGTMPRGKAQIEKDIQAAGGIISSGVSKRLNYLVAGPGSGSKSEKAAALGVKIITEDELYGMLGK